MTATATSRDWKLVAVVAVVAVAVATFLSLVAIQVVRVSGQGPAVPATVAAAPSRGAQPEKTAAPEASQVDGVSQVGDKVYYTVQPFDIAKREGCLTFIAQRFHTTVEQLVKWNNIKDPDRISVHQRLRVR